MTLTSDRGRIFGALVDGLRSHGGEFLVLENTLGQPNKVLVNMDGQRMVVAVGQR